MHTMVGDRTPLPAHGPASARHIFSPYDTTGKGISGQRDRDGDRETAMMKRLTTRRSKGLLGAVLAAGILASAGTAHAARNQCVYCIDIFGWGICFTTPEPIPGGDTGACRI